MKYVLYRSSDMIELAEMVNDAIVVGGRPQGGVACFCLVDGSIMYAQAVMFTDGDAK